LITGESPAAASRFTTSWMGCSMTLNSSGSTSSMMSSMTNTLSVGRYAWSVLLMSRAVAATTCT